MHSASGPSPCVRYSNVSWLARTVPLLKSCMALPPAVYASLLALKRAPVRMDMDKVVRRHGIRFWVLVSASPSPARHDQGRHSAPRLRQPSTPGGLALGLLLLAVGALVATGRLHARRKAAVPATGEQPGTCWLLVWLLAPGNCWLLGL